MRAGKEFLSSQHWGTSGGDAVYCLPHWFSKKAALACVTAGAAKLKNMEKAGGLIGG